jgi:hypothetical protein
MLKSTNRALAMLRRRGVMTLVPAGHVPSLVQEICGGPVQGSWWALPQSRLIYAISSALEDSPGVLALKLLDGKMTFVHRSLWPALVRFATDRHRRDALIASLRPPESRLLAEVERRGELHFGGGAPPAASTKTALERRWLCISTSEHTASGRHATVLRSWRHWADPELLRAARTLTFEGARHRLVAACVELGDADAATEAARSGHRGSGKRTLTNRGRHYRPQDRGGIPPAAVWRR